MYTEENTKIEFKKKEKSGLISVIIPVYNDAFGLENTLKSLRKQKPGEFKSEIIVANDGNLTEEKKICKKYNVACFSIEPRKGSYNARDTALENSSGEYLAFIDAGSLASKPWLLNGCKALKKYDYVGGPVEIVRDPRINISESFFLYQKVTSFDIEKFYFERHFFPTTNLFVKRKVIETLGGFDRRLQSGGDGEFGVRVFRSGYFTQKYERGLKVFHYTRNFKSLVERCKRISKGVVTLQKKHPSEFRSVSGTSTIYAILNFLFGPFLLFNSPAIRQVSIKKRIEVIIIAVFINIIDYSLYAKFKLVSLLNRLG